MSVDPEKTDKGGPPPGSFAGYALKGGLRFGPCILVRPLGAGGMGEVWLAVNEAEGGRQEAVKILRGGGAGSDDSAKRDRERFIREAKTALSLGLDDKIVRTYDVAEEGGLLYIRMEFADGLPLDRIDRVPGVEALAVFKRLAAALAVGHARGIVHRDVKPSNYMRLRNGRVKLMDFGLARAVGSSSLTKTGDSLGTPAYMSPEQWQDAKRADLRSDVYSLGVTFYRLLTGRLPFEADRGAPVHVYYAKLLTEPPIPIAPDELRGAPPALAEVILKAMAKRPEDRFKDAVELHQALRKLGREGDVADRDDGDRVSPEERRSRRRWILLMLFWTIAMIVLGLVLAQRGIVVD